MYRSSVPVTSVRPRSAGRDASRLIRSVGVDRVMFETDFPHPSCLYPVTPEFFALPGLDDGERKKVLSGNAAGLYAIPLD